MVGTVACTAFVAVWVAAAIGYMRENYKQGFGPKANPRLHH